MYPEANDHVPVITMMEASADYPLVNGVPTFVPNGATQYTAAMIPGPCFQEVELDGQHYAGCVGPWINGTPTAQWIQQVRGRWHHWETLYEIESPGGMGDGSAYFWIDGVLSISIVHRLRYFPTTTTPYVWNWTSWTPVYGGGGSIPNDGIGGYHRLKDLYVSGKP